MIALGRVLALHALDFAATLIVVGGSIARAWHLIEPPLRSGLAASAPAWSDGFRVVRAGRIDDAALIGAARHALAAGAPGVTVVP